MRKDEDILGSVAAILRKDEKNLIHFFATRKDPKWFLPLLKEGFFDPSQIPQTVKTERGITLVNWPQANYLEHIALLIQNKELVDRESIDSFLGVLRKIDGVDDNFLLARQLFISIFRIPSQYLSTQDVNHAFEWLKTTNITDTLIENAVQEGFAILIKQTTDNQHEREIFKSYLLGLFTLSNGSQKRKSRVTEPELKFFSNHGRSEFSSKHFQTEHLVKSKPFLLTDTLNSIEAMLAQLIDNSNLDSSTQYWRPAVEPHSQNNYHDSAQSVFVGFIFKISTVLLEHNFEITQIPTWRNSKFYTFKRIYMALGTEIPQHIPKEECAKLILELGFINEMRHEIFTFIKRHFPTLEKTIQDKIIEKINSIQSEEMESPELAERYTAWEKLRWLEAIPASSNEKADALKQKLMQATEGKVPEHPDFSSYMSAGWVGPQSPISMVDFAKLNLDQKFDFLIKFKSTEEHFVPTEEGLGRLLESFVTLHPLEISGLVQKLDLLHLRYVSSIIDGYAKSWVEKKFVPVQELITKIHSLITSEKFKVALNNEESKASWVLTSLSNLIESGTKTDENSFPETVDKDIYSILKLCLQLSTPDKRFDNSSDGYTRAINEPRGKLFEALIIFTLRRARNSKATPDFPKEGWEELQSLIDPVLAKTDPQEASLYALLGIYYRQFLFLNERWFYERFDIIAPSPDKAPILWRSFMDGYSYVTAYVKPVYLLLKERGYLVRYLRLDVSKTDNSRLDRLQNRIIELALIAYILGDEELSKGVLADIIDSKMADEWQSIISSLTTIVADTQNEEHLVKAISLVTSLLKMKSALPTERKWRDAFRGLSRFLELLKEPNHPLVMSIFEHISFGSEGPWEINALIEYLHRHREASPKRVGELFRVLLQKSDYVPTWPAEKIREICNSLVKNNETSSMIEVCRFYAERSVSCEPIRDICDKLV